MLNRQRIADAILLARHCIFILAVVGITASFLAWLIEYGRLPTIADENISILREYLPSSEGEQAHDNMTVRSYDGQWKRP